MKPDKTPHMYDQKPFNLDGRIDFSVMFQDKIMHTAIYVKIDAHDQLLLSDGVCHQLGVISYHDNVEPWRRTAGRTTK